MRLYKILLLVSLMSALVLSSCGSPDVGVTPASTVKPSDSSPEVEPTHTPISSPVTPYAFVRQSQLWVSLDGRNPVQGTHFDYRSADPHLNIYFGQPLWFANDRFVAFTLKTLPSGLGGGGCGFDGDYGRSGELFVLDTTSMQLAQISVSGEQSLVRPGVPYNGYWEYLFSEDAAHLLAWHADTSPKGEGAGGLYRYDLNARTLTLIIPSSSVPGADNHEAWYPMRYSSGHLYYETRTPAYGDNTVYTIYSHSLLNPGMPSTKVLDAGSEPFCASQGNNPNSPPVSGPFSEPGWDVSLDGKYLAAQTMVTNGGTTSGSVKVVLLSAGTTLTLFAQAPTQVLNHDASLSWSQDGQTVVLKALISQITLYSVTLSSPTMMQTYNTNGTVCSADYMHLVHMVWRGDGGVFAVFSLRQFEVGFDLSCVANVYEFSLGQPNETLLLANAYNFAWG